MFKRAQTSIMLHFERMFMNREYVKKYRQAVKDSGLVFFGMECDARHAKNKAGSDAISLQMTGICTFEQWERLYQAFQEIMKDCPDVGQKPKLNADGVWQLPK